MLRSFVFTVGMLVLEVARPLAVEAIPFGKPKRQAHGFSEDMMKTMIKYKLGDIDACHSENARFLGPVKGRVNLDVSIDALGRTVLVGMTRDTSYPSSLTNCIMDRVAKWRFPASKNGNGTGIRYPLELWKSKAFKKKG